jgi:prepilin signal peptidase PulO-like enzyme (type II secretory pathway)
LIVFFPYECLVVKSYSVFLTPGLPPQAWWVGLLTLFILGLAATIDAFTATIPDTLMFFGLLAVVILQGSYVSWPFASMHLSMAIAAGLAVWAINQAWYLFFKQDALGMGDAKWSMLAVALFDLKPVLVAWGLGACLAVIWLMAAQLVRYQTTRVHFAPFLFVGLLAGLYWYRLAPLFL